MQGTLKSTDEKLTKRNDALETMIIALKEETETMARKIEELEGELVVCGAIVRKWMMGAAPKRKMNVSKLKEFKGTRSIRDVDYFLQGDRTFKDGLKHWAKQELHQLEVKELTKVMAEAESFVELGPRKEKFEFPRQIDMQW
ncbi:hypothetical protein Gotur_013859 [Gossypium turneri]